MERHLPRLARRHQAGAARPHRGGVVTPDGKGYWLVSATGVVTTFGDAKFFGSMPVTNATAIVGIVADANIGYRLITAQGNAIAFGTTPS